MAGSKGSKDKEVYAFYYEVESEADLAKAAMCSGRRFINAVSVGKKFRAFVQGEKFNDLRILYYKDMEKPGSMLTYSHENGENASVADSAPERQDFRQYMAQIIELSSSPYKEEKDFKRAGHVIKAEIKDYAMLAKGVAALTADDEGIPKMYSFFYKGEHILGSFDLFREGAKIFSYSKIPVKESFGVLRYDYTNGSVKPAVSLSDNIGVYIRIINLKNPFPFF